MLYTQVITLLNTYSRQKHNLSLTAKVLGTLNSDMKTKRFISLVQTEDIPLLQECAFIQHRTEIEKYMAELKENEKKEFDKLKV